MATEASATAEPAEVTETVRKCILLGEVTSSGALCDVISFLAHAAWWGELVVEHGDTTRSLFFDEGHVVAAQSTAASERLGAVLVECGALTAEQAEACAERAADRNLRFGEALVELGFIQREKLFALMSKQVQAIFAGMAAIESGQFFFFDGFDDAQLSFRQRHSVDALLLDAIRKMDETRYFRSRIPSDDHVPVRMSEASAPATDPHGIFGAIDGKRNVSQLAQSVGLAELDVTRALFQHVHTGHAGIKPPRLDARKTIEVYNDAIVVLLRELDAMDEGDGVRASLAKFATVEGSESFFAEAKPAEDGTLDISETVRRIESAADPRLAEEKLGKWLYDYASYAVFLARPHLERRDQATSGKRVSRRVAELLDPIAPPGDTTMAPPELVVPAKVGPRAPPKEATSTLRMRRFTTALVPGLDPSRTARLAPVTAETLAQAAQRAKRVPLANATAAMPKVALPLPSPAAAPPRAAANADLPSPPARKGPNVVSLPVMAAVSVLCVVLGAAVASRGRWLPSAASRTELVIACEPDCATIYVDGKKAPSVNEPIAVSSGTHEVVVARPGHAQGFKRVSVSEGESKAVAFPLVAQP